MSLFTDDATTHAERITKALHRKVWQHASPGALDHARQVLQKEIENVIFHVRINDARQRRENRQTGRCNCDGEWFQEHVTDCPAAPTSDSACRNCSGIDPDSCLAHTGAGDSGETQAPDVILADGRRLTAAEYAPYLPSEAEATTQEPAP